MLSTTVHKATGEYPHCMIFKISEIPNKTSRINDNTYDQSVE